MKNSLLTLFVIGVVNQSCTLIDYKNAKDKVRKVEQLVKTGDNIRTARTKLIANGFSPSEIHFRSTVTKRSHHFTLRLTEQTQLDYIGYAFETNLNPWRSGIPDHMVFRSGLDEIIYSIDTN